MQSEYGIALYGIIPPEKIQFIDVDRKYDMLQRKALGLGYSIGDVIPQNLTTEINSTIKK